MALLEQLVRCWQSLCVPAPEGFGSVSPCIRHMGVHYVRKDEWPLGPILGYDENGNLIFIEYMVSQKDLQEGVSWENLPGIAGRPIDHTNIHFHPKGHRGWEIPHYDIHLYFIKTDAVHHVCPDGVPGAEHGAKVIRYPAR